MCVDLQGHLKEGYGRLIAFYCKLVVQKLTFHQKVGDVWLGAVWNFLRLK